MFQSLLNDWLIIFHYARISQILSQEPVQKLGSRFCVYCQISGEIITETDFKGQISVIYINNDQIILLIWWLVVSKLKIDVVNSF